MKNILDILSLKHQTWINYVASFGCEKNIAEDFVQEMYIKIYSYSLKKDNIIMFNDNEVNYFFIYVTLKNMYYDDIRFNKKRIKVDIEDVFIYEDEYTETVFNNRYKLLSTWILKLDNQINEINEYTDIKAQLYYIKFIYEKVFVQKRNVTELSKELGISYWSIRNTAKIIKNQILNEI